MSYGNSYKKTHQLNKFLTLGTWKPTPVINLLRLPMNNVARTKQFMPIIFISL